MLKDSWAGISSEPIGKQAQAVWGQTRIARQIG